MIDIIFIVVILVIAIAGGRVVVLSKQPIVQISGAICVSVIVAFLVSMYFSFTNLWGGNKGQWLFVATAILVFVVLMPISVYFRRR